MGVAVSGAVAPPAAGEFMNRMLRHLLTTRSSQRRAFPAHALAAVEAAIHAAEREHSGEIRFAIETALDSGRLWSGTSARARAIEIFTQLRVWDTGRNNGVLIYLLLADRDIEIVADRGFDGRVEVPEWEEVCRCMENEFRAGRFEAGAIAGVHRVSAIIARHFPAESGDRNELPNAPVLIG